MSFHAFTAGYDLARKGLVHWRAVPADGHPWRSRHDVRSDPTLVVTVHAAGVCVEVEHHYTSGHAWWIDDDRDLLLDGPVDAPEVRDRVGDALADAAIAIARDPARWRPEVLGALFEPRRGLGPDRVPAAEADAWELGRAVGPEGRPPYLTLRVLAEGQQIVLDHSFAGWPRERRLEPVHVPADAAAVAATFGTVMVDAVAWVRAHRLR